MVTLIDLERAATHDRARPCAWVKERMDRWAYWWASYQGRGYKDAADADGNPTLTRLLGEPDSKYTLRKNLSRPPWHTRAAVGIHVDSVLASGASRDAGRSQDEYLKFLNNVDLAGASVDDFMREVAVRLLTFGVVMVGIDWYMPDPAAPTKLHSDLAGNRPFWAYVHPLLIRRYDADQRTGAIKLLSWVESWRGGGSGKAVEITVVEWTAEQWTRFDGAGRVLDSGANEFGAVPFLAVDYDQGEGLVSQFADVAKSIFNLDAAWATADAYVSDPTLIITGVSGSDRETDAKIATGLARAIQIQEGDVKYLQPDPSYAENYQRRRLALVRDFRQAARLQAGFMGEVGDGGTASVAQSGIAKAFDFRETARSFAHLAARLEYAERFLARMWALAVKADPEAMQTVYSREFNIQDLKQRTDELLGFLDTGMPREVQQTARAAFLLRHPDFDDHPDLAQLLEAVKNDTAEPPVTGFFDAG